jgi:signal transduction histidine kinase
MQVLLGLQSNALKFTLKGKVEIEVSIVRKWNETNEEEEKFLQISIIDTGIGIEKHN